MTTKEIIQYVKDHASGKVKIAFSDIDGILRGNIFRRKNFFPLLKMEWEFCDVIFWLGCGRMQYTIMCNTQAGIQAILIVLQIIDIKYSSEKSMGK
jgi:hypothetical protein